MNKKLYILLGFIVLVIIIIFGFWYFDKQNKPEQIDQNVYTIHFHTGSMIYDMESFPNKIIVKKSEQVQCIQAPCNPILVEDYSVTSKEEYRNKYKELVGDKKEITVQEKDIDEDTKKMFSKILKVDLDPKDSISYKVLDNKDDSKYSTRGYYVEEVNNKVLVTVAMGEKNTGGYSINLVRVNIIDDGAQIYFEEDKPSEKDVVTQAFTYPILQIEFDKMPKYIMAQSLDTYEKLERIN